MTIAELALCRSHDLLRRLAPEDLEHLLASCTLRELAAGEVLLRNGDANDTLYFLLRGRLHVILTPGESTERLTIEPGELTGEMSIIENRPVMAEVVAALPSTVLAMPARVFWEQYCSRTALVPDLLLSLVQRMRRTAAVVREEFERHVRYQMMQRELESAARIQSNLLPAVLPLFADPAVDVHPLFRPARVVGGDFYDALAVNPRRLALAIGDVSGKGMPAALFMVRVVTALRMILMRESDPAAILPELNRQLVEANDESMFVTIALLLLDPETGHVIYLNGGHLPALVAAPNQPFAVWDPPEGPLVGVQPGATYAIRERTLAPGETVVLYTDGITEAENDDREFFGLARTLATLSRSERQTASPFVDGLNTAVATFAGQTAQSDDITVLALTYRGRAGGAT